MKLQSNSMMGFKVPTPLANRLRRQRGNRNKYGERGRKGATHSCAVMEWEWNTYLSFIWWSNPKFKCHILCNIPSFCGLNNFYTAESFLILFSLIFPNISAKDNHISSLKFWKATYSSYKSHYCQNYPLQVDLGILKLVTLVHTSHRIIMIPIMHLQTQYVQTTYEISSLLPLSKRTLGAWSSG